MRKKLNLKLYFLFIGIFLIFNLSCESEDLASIVGVDTSTTYYTLSLNSIVCDDNKSPKCDENYIDYNDWMLVDKTIFTGELLAFDITEADTSLSTPVSNAPVLCEILPTEGISLGSENPTLETDDAQFTGATTTDSDGEFQLQFNDKGLVESFDIYCHYSINETSGTMKYNSDTLTVDMHSVYERIHEISIVDYEDESDNDVNEQIDFTINQVGPAQPATLTVMVKDEDGRGIPGIDVYLGEPVTTSITVEGIADCILSDEILVTSNGQSEEEGADELIGEAKFSIQIDETNQALQEVLSVIGSDGNFINYTNLELPIYIQNVDCSSIVTEEGNTCTDNILSTEQNSNIQIYISQPDLTAEQSLASATEIFFYSLDESFGPEDGWFLELPSDGYGGFNTQTYVLDHNNVPLADIPVKLMIEDSEELLNSIVVNAPNPSLTLIENSINNSPPLAKHTISTINSENPDELASLTIVAQIDKGNSIIEKHIPIVAGTLFAKNKSHIANFDLVLDTRNLILDGTSNSVTMEVTIRDAGGNPIEGIPVTFLNGSDYGTFANNNILSGSDGIVTNTLQNIEIPNASVLEEIEIIAQVIDSGNNNEIIKADSEDLLVGDLFGNNAGHIDELDLLVNTNTLTLDGTSNSVTMQAVVRDSVGNPIEGIPINFTNSSNYGTFITTQVISDETGIAANTLQNIETPNSSIVENIQITAKILNPLNNEEVLYDDFETIQIGDLFALNISYIDNFSLSLDTPYLVLDGTANSVTMQAVVKNAVGSPIEGVPINFINSSNYGTFANNNLLSGADGIVTNTLQNIDTPNPSILESIQITAEILDPANAAVLFQDTETLMAGDLFAIHTTDIASLDLLLSDNPLTLDGTSNSIIVQAIVSNASGIAVEGIPVTFSNASDYGTFANDSVISGSDGVAENILNNIVTPNSSIIENIIITASISDPESGNIITQNTQTLQAGDLFAQNTGNINELDLLLSTNTLTLDGTSNSITMEATIRDADGNPVAGIPVSFSNASSYGTFTNNNILSGPSGTAANTLQNINTPNSSILENIQIAAAVIHPLYEIPLVSDMETLQAGDLFAQNIHDVKSLDLLFTDNSVNDNILILDSSESNSITMQATVRDISGNPVEGIAVNFMNTSSYGTFEINENEVISGSDGIATNILNLNNIPNPDIIESITIVASIYDPGDNNEVIEFDSETLQAGNQIAFIINSISEVDLIVEGSESLILGLDDDSDNEDSEDEESTNSFNFRATVRDSNGSPVAGVPVSFINGSNYGTFTTTEAISGSDGVATNTLQNIVTADPSILESITITAKIFDPSNDTDPIFTDDQTVFIGNQFAYGFNDISLVDLLVTNNSIITINETSNSIILEAVVRDSEGNPVEGVPVHFANQSMYGVFTSNNILSGIDGVATNTLQNILTPDFSILESIVITASILDPADETTITQDTATLQVGNLFAQNINDISSVILDLGSNVLVLDGIENTITMQATVRDASGNPVEGIPVIFSNATLYGTFENNNVLSGADGIAINTLQNIETNNPSVAENITITASIINPSDQTVLFSSYDTLYAGNLFAFNSQNIDAIDLILSTNSLTLGESNSITMQATVRDATGNPVGGIPVTFENNSNYGTFEINNVLSESNGVATNTLQNIETPNPSIMQEISISASIYNPEDNSSITTDNEILQVGDLFAQNINDISDLDLFLNTNTIILDESSNSITMQATVRDIDGNPIEGIPVNFVNESSYGTFTSNYILSGADGIAANTLQNIDTPNSSILENIQITAEIINPANADILFQDTETLMAGDLFAQNINDIDALIFQIETSQIILDDQSDNSCAMLAIITDVNGNPVEGIPVNFTTTYDYAVFEQSDNMVSGITGAVSNTLQNISSPDPSSIEFILITANIFSPEDGSVIATANHTIYAGDQIAFTINSINQIDLIVEGSESLILDDSSNPDEEDENNTESNNSFTFKVLVKDSELNPVEGVPVSFISESDYGTFTTTQAISDAFGIATNILQNIVTPNPSVLESIVVVAKVFDPSDNTSTLFTDTQTVLIGNQFAYNLDNISTIDLIFNTNPLILDGSSASITMEATVRDSEGNPVSSVPVDFSNSSNYGTFSTNNILSGSNGIASNTLQNIVTPNPSIIQQIPIIVSIIDPTDGSILATDTQTLECGNLFSINVSSVSTIGLIFDANPLVLDGLSNSVTMQAMVRDATGNPIEGIPIIFSNETDYGTFESNDLTSGVNGIVINALQNIVTPNPSIMEDIPITISVLDPLNGIIATDTQTLQAGDLFANNINNIDAIQLSLDPQTLILDATTTNEDGEITSETNNSIAIQATVRDAVGNPIEGIPVNFINGSEYGTFTNNGVLSGTDGIALNTLQNIEPENPSIVEDITITVSILNPQDNSTLAEDTEILQVGNQFAFNYTYINSLILEADPTSLIIDDIPESDTDGGAEGEADDGDGEDTASTNDITLQATVKDINGNPIEGIFVDFFNTSNYGSFTNNGVTSGSDGVAENILQNITIENSQTGIEDIELSSSIQLSGEIDSTITSNTLNLNVAYQSALNIAQVSDLDVALIQFLSTDNNISIVHSDTLVANVQNEFGAPVPNVPISFTLDRSNCSEDNSEVDSTDIMGYISSNQVWTSSSGEARIAFTLSEGDLITCEGFIIETGITVYVSDNFNEEYTWSYEVEGDPNVEYDIVEFDFYSDPDGDWDPNEEEAVTTHYIDHIQGECLKLEHMALDVDGVLVEGAAVQYEIFNSEVQDPLNPGEWFSSNDVDEYDELLFPDLTANGFLQYNLATTGCDSLSSGTMRCLDACILDTLSQEIETACDENYNGLACNWYGNNSGSAITRDHIRAYIQDPEDPSTEAILFEDIVVVTSYPAGFYASTVESYAQPAQILIDSLDVVYCDTVTTVVRDQYGQALTNIVVDFSLDASDLDYGQLSTGRDTTGSIVGLPYDAARTVFCTFPNLDNLPPLINELGDTTNYADIIDITMDVLDYGNDDGVDDAIEIPISVNLPECPNCEASLTLDATNYELPTGDDNEIVTSQITATVIDTTENPVPPNTLVEFQSIAIDADGNVVPSGSIEPYKFTDENGQATATFNMETDVGLTQIIGTAPSFGLSDTIFVNLTSTDATSIQLLPPTPNEITVQGGGGVEATQITMEIKDGSDNLVTEPFLVHFRLLNTSPVGVYLNEQDEDYLVECAESSNGLATVTLNSGSQPGSVPLRAELYPADLGIECGDIDEATYNASGIASLEAVPVTVVTGAPAFGQINYSYVEIATIGGGQYELPLSISLWDFYSNPVADSTNVYIWIEGIADPWSVDSVYTFGDSVKWGGLDATGQVIEVDSLVYVWNNEDFTSNTPGLNNPSPGDDLSILGEPLWREIQHPGSIIGAAETGMESPDGISYPGIAWSTVRFGTASIFENTVIKALCYDADGEKLIIDGRDSHDGDGLLLPCFSCTLSDPAVDPGFVDFSLIGDIGLNDLDDTVAVTIQTGLTDFYQYPVNNGTLQAVATGATFWSACDPADTDLDGYVGECWQDNNANGVIDPPPFGGDIINEDLGATCTDCRAAGGLWGADPDDNPAFGNTNGNGTVVWDLSYSELLNIGDNNDPESYDTWPSQITIFLLDPLQISSSTLTYEIFKSEQNDNP